eukprot:582105-Pleurochrysis_carterae.AAC.1
MVNRTSKARLPFFGLLAVPYIRTVIRAERSIYHARCLATMHFTQSALKIGKVPPTYSSVLGRESSPTEAMSNITQAISRPGWCQGWWWGSLSMVYKCVRGELWLSAWLSQCTCVASPLAYHMRSADMKPA